MFLVASIVVIVKLAEFAAILRVNFLEVFSMKLDIILKWSTGVLIVELEK